jgi:preprotein translocase subunit SecG
MYTLITIIIVVVCVCLVLIVLVQNSKGGGLAANFSASNQIMGVRKTADFLEKATWTLAGSLIALCLLAAFILPSSGDADTGKSILDSQIENAAEPGSMPSFPTSAPITEPNDQTE